MSPSIYELISQYINFHASERERFIYHVMVGLEEIIYDDDYKYVLNYPEKRVTRQTYIAHKKKLTHTIKGLTLKASPAPPPVQKKKR